MNDSNRYDVTHDHEGNAIPPNDAAPVEQREQIGRYRIERVLGEGGFGVVYLACDVQLDRLVAIKVPHAKLISQPEDAQVYLVEARTVANLDHPHVVPVFDVGSTEDCPVYVVSKYIEGTDLSTKLKQLIDVILVADELAEFPLLLAVLKPHAAKVRAKLLEKMQLAMPAELDKKNEQPPRLKTNEQLSEADQQRRDSHWQGQSLAAVTLVQLGFGDDVWSLLELTPNPSLRSYIIHHLGKLGTDHNTLAARLQMEVDVTIRRALIQSLGGLDAELVSPMDRTRIAEQLELMYVRDPDSGIHSSASWTLRQWGVPLPDLPVGEPTLSDEQKVRIAKLTAEVEDIRQRIVVAEKELPVRQAAWERELREQPATLPDSLTQGLVAHYPLDETEGNETANRVEGRPSGIYAGPGQPEWVPGIVSNGV